MKICVLSPSYPRSKDDYWVPFMHTWAKELAKVEKVGVISSGNPKAKNKETRDKVEIHRFNYFIPKSAQKLTYTGGMREAFEKSWVARIQIPFFLFFYALKVLVIGRKYDVINAHWSLSGLAALPLKWIYGKPIVLTAHGSDIRALPSWLNKFILKRVDIITCAYDELIKKMNGWGFQDIQHVKNFLDEDTFTKKQDTKKIKKKLGIKSKNVVTWIGRFEDFKDPLNFVDSLPAVLKKNKDISIIIVGDGSLKSEIKKRIEKYKLEKHVTMPPPGNYMDQVLAVTDISVACSPYENCFSNTISESMLSKVACIITDAGYTKKFFHHKKYAYLVKPKNPKSLSDAINELLKNNTLRKQLTKNGHEFLEVNGFRTKTIRKQMLTLFKKAMKNS